MHWLLYFGSSRRSPGVKHWTADHWVMSSTPTYVTAACHHVSFMWGRLVYPVFSLTNVHRRVSLVHVSYIPYVSYVSKNVGNNIKREENMKTINQN